MPLPKPKAEESKDDWVDRCMGDPRMIAEFEDADQRAAVCIRAFGGEKQPETNEVSLKPPQSVVSNYRRGLKMHEEGKTGSGIEAGTIKVARDIVAGESVTREWVGKANRFWARNERFLKEPKDSPAYASALLWGGASGRDWYRSTAKKLEKEASNVAKEPALNFSTGEQVRVNVRCNVQTDQVRREQRDGRDVVVVPSYTLPDDIVMNGILYPAEEIAKSYKTLEGTPAPLGHPTVNRMFVSAKSPLGLNIGYFGAWNANVTRVDGRVFIEKVIDVKRATESEMGRRVLSALEANKPIHTSTGLLMNIRECTSSDLADWEGYDMEFDHDAILLDEDGAATPEQGVGMLVNEGQLKVINSDLEERMDEQIDMLGMELLSAMRRKEDVGLWSALKEAIMEVLTLGRSNGPSQRKEAMNMAENEGGYDKLNSRMDKLEERMNKMDEAISNMGKKTNAHEEVINSIAADREAERSALVNKVVEAELLSEEDAKTTPIPALKALINSAEKKAEKPVPAPGIPGGFQANQGDNVAQFSPLGEAKKEA